MQFRLNPVIIAGFDVIYVGRKGFSTIAHATKAMIRPKGAAKGTPWTEIPFGRRKTKASKENFLYRYLQQLTKEADLEAEAVIREEKKKRMGVPEPEKIKFQELQPVDKTIKSADGFKRDIRKYFFSTDKAYQFVKSKDINIFDVDRYLRAVKREFLKEVYPQHGKAPYLIRVYHDYKGLPSVPEIDPLQKGFSGMGLNRQVMDKSDVNEQFDILSELYLDNFTRYLNFARSDTFFRFTGFTAEVTLDIMEEAEKLPEYLRKQKKRRVSRVQKKRKPAKKKPIKKKPAKKKAAKKPAKKKPVASKRKKKAKKATKKRR